MNLSIVNERLTAIKQMPGFEFASRTKTADTPEEHEQEAAVFNELDEFLLVCTSETPEGYVPTDEDRELVKKVLNEPDTVNLDEAPSVVQAVAAVRSALQTYQMPINGQRCKNWSLFVNRCKDLLVEA